MADKKKAPGKDKVLNKKTKPVVIVSAILVVTLITGGIALPHLMKKSNNKTSASDDIIRYESQRDESYIDQAIDEGAENKKADKKDDTTAKTETATKKNEVDGTVSNPTNKTANVQEKVTVSSPSSPVSRVVTDGSGSSKSVPNYSVYRDSDIKTDEKTGERVIKKDSKPLDVDKVSDDGKSVTYVDTPTEIGENETKEVKYIIVRDGEDENGKKKITDIFKTDEELVIRVVAEIPDATEPTVIKDDTQSMNKDDIPTVVAPEDEVKTPDTQVNQTVETSSTMKAVWFGPDFEAYGVENVIFGKLADYPNITSRIQGEPVGVTDNDMVYVFADTDAIYVLANDKIVASDVSNMFAGMENLKYVDFSNIDLSEVVSAKKMFAGCTNLQTVSVHGFSSKLTNMSGMFQGCSSLSTIDMSGCDLTQVTDVSFLFKDCASLTAVQTSSTLNSVTRTVGCFDGSPMESFAGIK